MPRSHLLQRMQARIYFCDVAKELRTPPYNELLLTPKSRLGGLSPFLRRRLSSRDATFLSPIATSSSLSLEQKHSDDKDALQALRAMRKYPARGL
ncbi:hypothetical protein An07g02470 [Aspergillus niger]|uniref:Uncharacterized protein n=2 Tax=Aspergillus niger TaxID=5061 RepID=A2QMK8_ASPNC|nr:hypothetical protein An07g02470 [Aspergillus niger]CAK39336.1 hypothetical protein An07g02470 [Aspergillus niger]